MQYVLRCSGRLRRPSNFRSRIRHKKKKSMIINQGRKLDHAQRYWDPPSAYWRWMNEWSAATWTWNHVHKLYLGLKSHDTLYEVLETPKLNVSSISIPFRLNNADKQQALSSNDERNIIHVGGTEMQKYGHRSGSGNELDAVCSFIRKRPTCSLGNCLVSVGLKLINIHVTHAANGTVTAHLIHTW